MPSSLIAGIHGWTTYRPDISAFGLDTSS